MTDDNRNPKDCSTLGVRAADSFVDTREMTNRMLESIRNPRKSIDGLKPSFEVESSTCRGHKEEGVQEGWVLSGN